MLNPVFFVHPPITLAIWLRFTLTHNFSLSFLLFFTFSLSSSFFFSHFSIFWHSLHVFVSMSPSPSASPFRSPILHFTFSPFPCSTPLHVNNRHCQCWWHMISSSKSRKLFFISFSQSFYFTFSTSPKHENCRNENVILWFIFDWNVASIQKFFTQRHLIWMSWPPSSRMTLCLKIEKCTSIY